MPLAPNGIWIRELDITGMARRPLSALERKWPGMNACGMPHGNEHAVGRACAVGLGYRLMGATGMLMRWID